MSSKITIDPVTRIEGHLAVKVEVEDGLVTSAWASGEMFRGFENILKGRDPMDAQQITQRICGVCPVSHGTASILAQDDAYGIRPTKNGRILRNLILAANYIQSHIVHFYHLSALDFVDITAILQYQGNDNQLLGLKGWVSQQLNSNKMFPAAPFLPRYEGTYLNNTSANITAVKHYLEGLEMRALAHQACAIFSGKMPHSTALVPGGITEKATVGKIAEYRMALRQLSDFINTKYIPDVIAVASAFPGDFSTGKGPGNYMAFGVFGQDDSSNKFLLPAGILMDGKAERLDTDKIAEDIRFSHFSSGSGKHPFDGETVPKPEKRDAYTWLKAPRYGGKPMEVGPLARIMIAYQKGDSGVVSAVNSLLASTGLAAEQLNSTLGRHAARALECKLVADQAFAWLDELHPDKPTATDFEIPSTGRGVGLTEAPRGALSHWITLKDKKIENYQCVVPTTWNMSPRDDKGLMGPVEQSLIGTPIRNEEHPIEATRIVRSFDPCLACAVH